MKSGEIGSICGAGGTDKIATAVQLNNNARRQNTTEQIGMKPRNACVSFKLHGTVDSIALEQDRLIFGKQLSRCKAILSTALGLGEAGIEMYESNRDKLKVLQLPNRMVLLLALIRKTLAIL